MIMMRGTRPLSWQAPIPKVCSFAFDAGQPVHMNSSKLNLSADRSRDEAGPLADVDSEIHMNPLAHSPSDMEHEIALSDCDTSTLTTIRLAGKAKVD